ncbi:response regulator transcription factor [Streptomyces sp. NPDC052051]|uniref:response regulator transcription factor n=1 Tax=Streptomyces sp. NPDC052051 TaxID=3154649 RepID=UPI00343022F0
MPDDAFPSPGPFPPPVAAPAGSPGIPAFPPFSPFAEAPPAPPLRVVVADDNPVVRAGLTALLSGRQDLEVVAEAADGRQACELAVQHRPDVVLLDVRMPGVDGISALPHLVRIAPVLMMTYSREAEIVCEALRLGAGGYLVHGEFTADQLVAAVRDIRAGRAHLTPTASNALLASLRGGASAGGGQLPEGLGTTLTAPVEHPATELNERQFAVMPSHEQAGVAHSSPGSAAPSGAGEALGELSQREVEVMELIASGMTNQQIAATCFISQKTVKNHINRIFAKLNAQSRGEAIALWNRAARGGHGRG